MSLVNLLLWPIMSCSFLIFPNFVKNPLLVQNIVCWLSFQHFLHLHSLLHIEVYKIKWIDDICFVNKILQTEMHTYFYEIKWSFLFSEPKEAPVEVMVHPYSSDSIKVTWRGITTFQDEEPLQGYMVHLIISL